MVVEESQPIQADVRTNAHPLDPLTVAEIEQAAALCRERHPSEHMRFVSIALHEPPKAEVYAFDAESPPVRRAFIVAIERGEGTVYEGVVNLDGGSVETWEIYPGAQPNPTFEEYQDADRVIRADERWQEALRRRGVTDFDKVQIDPWPAGNFGDPVEQGRRILRGISYVRDEKASNGYARPIEGVVAVVDLNAKEVITLVDEGDAPVPAVDLRYDAEVQPSLREDLRPLEITQPDGASRAGRADAADQVTVACYHPSAPKHLQTFVGTHRDILAFG